ncbi:lysophospholipid acyltransferase family protein [Alienimonas californiensis]|uniref:DUF374 domain-containing protein n=1 Tax=Alienimonas californiensis TaxID=2527989 RepID=A0A517P732_9PLAN|nr:lysophospholipid acyltransferase family protein [Alienimonas californiensis]QDT15174.1 hypothetical protein CA12_12550 [Alienimonas californiensis]
MKIRNKTLNRLLAVFAARLLTVWMRTCRVEAYSVAGASPFAGRLGEPGRPAACGRFRTVAHDPAAPHTYSFYPFWHEWIVPYVFVRPHAQMAGLISQHRDGGYLADAMTAVGLKTVRGSTSRGGAAAVKQIMDECADWDLGITPDGPRGPRRELKPGVAFLASRTGRPIVPTAVACSSAWVVKGSWTDLVLPKPFSRVVFCAGAPLTVPPDADRNELNAWCRRIETAIAQQESRAGVIANGGADPGIPTAATSGADALDDSAPVRRAA